MVKGDGVEEFPGELLAAVEDRLDGGAADEVGQAADHPAGAAVQVLVESGQGAGLVAVQPERVFEGGDQALPFGGEQEREGGDEGEPAGDLASAGAGEQAFALDVDAGVYERGGDALGEVLQGVGYFGAAAGGELEVVYPMGFSDRRTCCNDYGLWFCVAYMSATLVRDGCAGAQVSGHSCSGWDAGS
jgi:hypothetical protein